MSSDMFFLAGFDIGSFFSNLTSKVGEWGSYFIMFLGVVLVIAGIIQIVKAFMSQGRGQVNWLMTAGMILIGAFLASLGFSGVMNLANVGVETVNSLGTTT